jgi:hypothetical protein
MRWTTLVIVTTSLVGTLHAPSLAFAQSGPPPSPGRPATGTPAAAGDEGAVGGFLDFLKNLEVQPPDLGDGSNSGGGGAGGGGAGSGSGGGSQGGSGGGDSGSSGGHG